MIAIIQNAKDGITTINDKATIELINPVTCAVFDYKSEEVIGGNLRILMPHRHDDYLCDARLRQKQMLLAEAR